MGHAHAPSAWNCKCSVRKTRRAVTPAPAEGPDEEGMPSALRQNPGKTASPLKLSEHPYLKGQMVVYPKGGAYAR